MWHHWLHRFLHQLVWLESLSLKLKKAYIIKIYIIKIYIDNGKIVSSLITTKAEYLFSLLIHITVIFFKFFLFNTLRFSSELFIYSSYYFWLIMINYFLKYRNYYIKVPTSTYFHVHACRFYAFFLRKIENIRNNEHLLVIPLRAPFSTLTLFLSIKVEP